MYSEVSKVHSQVEALGLLPVDKMEALARHTPLISTFRRQKQAELCKHEDSFVYYIVSSRRTRESVTKKIK